MLTLALDVSALTASVAVVEENRVLSLLQSTNKLNHSVRLLPMIDHALSMAEKEITDLSLIAVSAGPGSFTGVRIGISTVKGLAFQDRIPCAPVSTLEALAYTHKDANALVCALMDARRGEFYQALFQAQNGTLSRVYPDRAIDADTLEAELIKLEKPIILTGDGAELFFEKTGCSTRFCLSSPVTRLQNAASVAFVGTEMYQNGLSVPASKLAPIYLRQSGAERKRMNKEVE